MMMGHNYNRPGGEPQVSPPPGIPPSTYRHTSIDQLTSYRTRYCASHAPCTLVGGSARVRRPDPVTRARAAALRPATRLRRAPPSAHLHRLLRRPAQLLIVGVALARAHATSYHTRIIAQSSQTSHTSVIKLSGLCHTFPCLRGFGQAPSPPMPGRVAGSRGR